ncbi:hypothetical protein [Sphaerisporangium flaviroseum]|uniref:hypothetical protein n=1 Tax=Sphaerisporangium flaviroseum TaxID=509199 RepID=UPI0031EC42C0
MDPVGQPQPHVDHPGVPTFSACRAASSGSPDSNTTVAAGSRTSHQAYRLADSGSMNPAMYRRTAVLAVFNVSAEDPRRLPSSTPSLRYVSCSPSHASKYTSPITSGLKNSSISSPTSAT